MAEEPRLLVVSNRLPLTLRRAGSGWRSEPSTGGLATALAPVLKRTRGLWIGWPGDVSERFGADRGEVLRDWEERHGYVGVDIPPGVVQRFYQGYANGTLWPLFHQFPSRLEFDPKDWEAYIEANRIFRDAVLERLRPGDLVWVHDYQLMLLPQLLREAAPEAVIGFFLHIPFPASDVFRILPRREELLRGLLGADSVVFQTHGHLQHFRSSLLRILGIGSRMDRVEAEGRFVSLDAMPIGIGPEEFTAPLESDRETRRSLEELRRRFSQRGLLLAVDRLDYTKGIPERLRAFRRLLAGRPDLHGKVVLVQIAVPSRDRILRYRELREEVNRLVGEINGDYSTPGWTPIVYIRRAVPRRELVGLYAAADVGWVTPLRDGMNLVAKEYVACHRGQDGVLVLSEFAGAAAEMGEALLVNPYDEDRVALAVGRALSLTPDEQRERMSSLYRRVVRNDSRAWSEGFLAGLRRAALLRAQGTSELPAPLPVAEVVAAYRSSRTRLLMLDYDGTLAAFADRPADVVPSTDLLGSLARLAADARNRVALVSGRPRTQLGPWFGGVAGLWLVAEHGALIRSPATGEWETLRKAVAPEWKERVRPVLEHYADRTPGSFVEEKEYSLVWHYRMSEPEFGEWQANELVANLEEMLAESELRAVRGHKGVEVKITWANKGEAAAHLEGLGPLPDFELGVGDDRTDEDLFERLPASAWTVHVGEGASRARHSLPGPPAVQRLLLALVAGDALE
jgi:trehalose 6-phosphate synthase/phosphatase